MNNRILLLTKDALCKSYLPIYGNTYWKGKTPNLDELALKGTVFNKFYTSAPSTVMAIRGIVMGKFAFDTPYIDYIPMEVPENESDLFNYARSLGYEGHLLWDAKWDHMVLRYGNCLGKDTIIHNVEGLNQPVGPHCNHKENIKDNDVLLSKTIAILEKEVSQICDKNNKIFLWIHLPHVLMGRSGYGGDIDGFDKCIGMLRQYFDDDSIWISADHGNMDGYKDKFSYGFDVYTPAIQIPFIAPRINDMAQCNDNVSNIDLKKIIFENDIPKRRFIYSESAYYAQPHRKIALLKDDFAYIYSKKGKKEELYDLIYDEHVRCNMISDYFYDTDRLLATKTREVYFSPRWEERDNVLIEFREEFKRIWKKPPFLIDLRGRGISFAKKTIVLVRDKTVRKIIKN